MQILSKDCGEKIQISSKDLEIKHEVHQRIVEKRRFCRNVMGKNVNFVEGSWDKMRISLKGL